MKNQTREFYSFAICEDGYLANNKWSESEWLEPTIIEIINQAGKLVEPWDQELPYEVLLNDYGLNFK